MNKAIKLILLILSLATLCLGDRIIPDPNFPVLIRYPRRSYDATTTTGTANTVIEFRFRLPTRTNGAVSASGIGYKQFFGIRFEDLTGLGNLSVGCSLSSTTTTIITVGKVNSAATESNKAASDKTIYCQLLDKVNSKLIANETYTLSLTFNTMLSNAMLQKIILFTSTTNTEDALIIDHLPSLGSLFQYTNYESDDNNKIVTISSSNVSLTTITSPSDAKFTTLYPNFTFDLRVVVKVEDFWIIHPSDFLFYFKYATTSFTAPNSIDTEAIPNSSDSKTTGALASGQLSFNSYTDGLIITGFKADDLFPRRSFVLVLKGMTTRDQNLGVSTSLRFEVFYRNTYSIVSYSKINMNAVQIALITATAHHPEYFPMYDGMGWPFQFNFSVNTKFDNGGYLVIRHRNYAIASNVVNLVASTVEFLGSFEQSFGRRLNCYPLRNDFNYAQISIPTGAVNYDEASGIFCKMTTIAINTEYRLKIWGIVEKCAGPDANKVKMYASTLTFTIRIFKSAKPNDTVLNESIFPLLPTTENWILAQTTDVSILENCFGLQTRSENTMADINKVLPKRKTSEFYPIGLEVNNFNLMVPPTVLTELNKFESYDLWTESGDAGQDGDLNTSKWGAYQYLFGGSSTNLANQSLFVTAMIPTRAALAGNFMLADYIPSECIGTGSADAFIGKAPGTSGADNEFRIQWLFSRDFLTEGTTFASKCQLNWQYQNQSALGADANLTSASIFGTVLYVSSSVSVSDTVVSTDRLLTSITSLREEIVIKSTTSPVTTLILNKNMATTNDLSKIDSSSTASGAGATYKISSNRIDMTTRTLSMIGYDCNKKVTITNATFSHSVQFGLFTNCLKVKATPSTVTSIYTYFEMQQILLYNNKYPSRVVRFIKLYPEIGIFQPATIGDTDTTNTNNAFETNIDANNSNEKWIVGHYETTSASSSPFAVCLIEINSKLINAYKGSSSNVLIIWLFGASLLDVDITSESSEYPVAPLASATAYGLNAGQTMSFAHRRLGDTAATASKYPAVDKGTSTEDNLGELEIYFLKTVAISKYRSGSNEQNDNRFRGVFPRRTYYQFFLGSTIYIPTSTFPAGSTSSYAENLYVPILCPSAVGNAVTTTLSNNTTFPTNGVYWTAPIATVAWATMDRYNSVSKIDNYIRPKVLDNTYETLIDDRELLPYDTVRYTPIQVPIYRSPKKNDDFLLDSNPRQLTSTTTRNTTSFVMKVQFKSYALTTNDDPKTLSLINISGNDKEASAFSIFLNSTFDTITTSVTNTISANLADQTMRIKTMKAPIYILGKAYNRFLAFSKNYTKGSMYGNHPATGALGAANTWSNAVFTLTKNIAISLVGIPRLAISTFDSNDFINPLNFIAVFTNRNVSINTTTATNNGMLTNLKVTDNSGTVTFQNFLLWHPNEYTATAWSSQLTVDITDKAINEDRGGNIRIAGTFPTEVPKGSEVVLTFANGSVLQASTVTVCGTYNLSINEIVNDCTVSSPKITCKLNARTSKFNICCYNVYNDNSEMKITSGQLYTNYDTTILTTSLLNTAVANDNYNLIWYSDPADTSKNTLASFNFTTRSVESISAATTSFYAKVTNVSYRLSSTENGFGLATFNVELPRNAARGMTLKITGDLARLKIPNITTRILPVFGNSGLYGSFPENETGNLFLDYVYTDFDTSGIVVKLKNMVYKCGLSLSTSVNITLWPVLTASFNAVDLTVTMTGAGGNALAATKAFNISSTSVPLINSTLPVTTISNDFCSISSISPKIVDEYAVYTFNFTFNQFSSALENSAPNEIILLLPYMLYGDYPDVTCMNGTTTLQCNYIEKSMLSIRFPNSINVTGDTALQVTLIGLINPYLTTNNGVYFGCALTRANHLLGTRNYLVRGSTTITEGIVTTTNNVTYGNIIFKNSLCRHSFSITNISSSATDQGQAVADEELLNPREDPPKINSVYRTVHDFGFTLDIANNLLPNRVSFFTLTNSPVLYITFPADYKFSLYTFTPTAEIEAYESSELDLTEAEPITDFITVSSVEVMGNLVKISFTQTSFTFDKYFQHFRLRLINLPPPVENTENTTTGRITTEGFNFLWANSDLTMIFKSWRNLNNFSNIDITGTNADRLRVSNKGFKYVFDQKKWVIDIQMADNSNSELNYLNIKAGIFNRGSIKVRSVSRLIAPGKVGLTIDHPKIKFSETPYAVTALEADSIFTIGLPCGEEPGWVWLLPQLKVNDDSPGVMTNPYLQFMPLAPLKIQISTQNKGIIRFQAAYVVRINGSHFVDFSLSEPSVDVIPLIFKESADSLIEKLEIAPNMLEGRTVFRITNANASSVQSYEMGTPSNNCYEFQFPKISFTIDGVAAIIPNDAINQSMFEYKNADTDLTITDFSTIRFNFVTEYTQIYVYAALICFTDDFPTDEQMKSQNVTTSRRLAYYSEILNIKGSAVIDFTNLIRGNAYKLKVFIESTQGDKTLRTSSQMVKLNQTLTNGTIVSLMAGSQVNPLCASYRFKSRPGIQITNPLLWYWQDKFSEGGYEKSGCITAVDQYGTNIPGLPSVRNETTCGRQNCRFIDRPTYNVSETQKDNSETYIICAYPYSTCATNPVDYTGKFNALLTELSNNETVNTAINAFVVPEFTLTTATDSDISKAPSITDIKLNGNVAAFTAVADKGLSCYVRVSSGAQPALTDFDTCSTGCQPINLSTTSGSYQVNIPAAAGTYNVYAVCFNDMPCSDARSTVFNWGSVTRQGSSNGNNNQTNNGTDGNGTNAKSTYHYFTASLLMLLAIIFFE